MGAGINDSYDELHEGDRLSASQYNRLTSQVTRLSQMDRGRMRHLNNACGIFTLPEEQDGLLFYNGSGSQIPPFGLVLVNDVKSSDGPDNVANVKQPDSYGCQWNCLVNGPSTVSSGDFGFAQYMDGPVIIAYDSSDGTPLFADHWGPRNGTFLAKFETGGFFIIGIYDLTNHYALAMPSPMYSCWIKNLTGSTISKNFSGTVTVVTGTLGSETTTGITLSAFARWGDFKNNAYGRASFNEISTNSQTKWIIEDTDTC